MTSLVAAVALRLGVALGLGVDGRGGEGLVLRGHAHACRVRGGRADNGLGGGARLVGGAGCDDGAGKRNSLNLVGGVDSRVDLSSFQVRGGHSKGDFGEIWGWPTEVMTVLFVSVQGTASVIGFSPTDTVV